MSFYLPEAASKMFFTVIVEALHHLEWRVGYGNYFYRPRLQLEKEGKYTPSLRDSTTMGTTGISAHLAKISLLLGTPVKRYYRVLVSYCSPSLIQDVSYGSLDCYIGQCLHPWLHVRCRRSCLHTDLSLLMLIISSFDEFLL